MFERTTPRLRLSPHRRRRLTTLASVAYLAALCLSVVIGPLLLLLYTDATFSSALRTVAVAVGAMYVLGLGILLR